MRTNLDVVLGDLTKSIEDITLGSIEYIVIEAAGNALIDSWNDQPDENKINENLEKKKWAQKFQ